METLPILQGLTNDQFDKLLDICTKRTVSRNTVIYEEGEPSRDMFILTEGVLQVSLWGKEIGRIFPISPVGEMGLFTNEGRSADVTSRTQCTLLRITHEDLFDLFEKDKDLHIRFQRGMITELAQKLRGANELLAKQRSKLDKGR